MLTKEAALLLARSVRTIQAHITAGNLHAVKIGRDYHIDPGELERFKVERRAIGRPKKTSS